MISKRLQTHILKSANNLRSVNQVGRNIFYKPTTNHILSGFYIDNGENYVYFGRIITPICDKLGFIGPRFGGRIEGDCWGIKKGKSDLDIVVPFIECTNVYNLESERIKDTRYFLQEFRNHDALSNLIYRRSYANCLIANGNSDIAKYHLAKVIHEIESHAYLSSADMLFLQDTMLIRDELERSLSCAQSLIFDWELENKRRLLIE